VRLGFPSAHVQSHFADDRLRHDHVDPIDSSQVHSADSIQFTAHVEGRRISLGPLRLFYLGCLWLLRRCHLWRRSPHVVGKLLQMGLQFPVAFGDFALVGERQAGVPRIPGGAANHSGLRSHAHDPEGAGPLGKPQRCSASSSVHQQALRIGRPRHRPSLRSTVSPSNANRKLQHYRSNHHEIHRWQTRFGSGVG
jgi:hypothetical protein